MSGDVMGQQHSPLNPFLAWRPRDPEGLAIVDRRGMIKASMAGLAGLSLPKLLKARELNP